VPEQTSRTVPAPDTEWLVNQIAHTMRNPIFAAMVQAEALVMRAGEDPKISNAARLVHRQLKRLEDDINEMLLLGRPAKINPRKVDLRRVMEQLASGFRQGEHGEKADVQVVADAPSFDLETDPEAVKLIVKRLVVNAVEHTPPPHAIRLELARDPDGTARIAVEDHGDGILPEIQERIFLPFFPQHSGRPGLGLAVAAKFAHALGGHLTIRSEPGEGTLASWVQPPEPV
jgi:two-component system OmpR family sensor kinase